MKLQVMETIQFPEKPFGLWSRIAICGSSGSGKSVILHKLLKHSQYLFAGKTDLILYFSLMDDLKLFQDISQFECQFKFYKGLDELESVLIEHKHFARENGVVVVLEDLQLEAFNNETVAKIFTAYAHHMPLTGVIITCQSPYLRTARYQTIINRNLTHYIFSRSPRLRSGLCIIGREIDPMKPKQLLSAFNQAISNDKGFPYLVVDLNEIVYYSGIFPGECAKVFLE